MSRNLLLYCSIILSIVSLSYSREDVWINVGCNDEYEPDNCIYENGDLSTVDDYDRCGPAQLSVNARNYFLAAAGRKTTYKRNKDAFDKIKIQPKMLQDVSVNNMRTTVLGYEVDFPIGASPTGRQKLAHPAGELATVRGLYSFRTIMILSSYATTRIEEVGELAHGTKLRLWMQTYIFRNRSLTVDIVRKAESNGFKGIVLTADSPLDVTVSCNAREKTIFPPGVTLPNLGADKAPSLAATFKDITWLTKLTKMPIIVKGLLTGRDAIRAIKAGASAILISNHGGRQMDGDPSTIEVLPGVVDAVHKVYPHVEVYMDSGVRSGHDVYKAIASGARMVFLGRSILWGLAIAGAKGVNSVVKIISQDFNETMIIGGSANVSEIARDTVIPPGEFCTNDL